MQIVLNLMPAPMFFYLNLCPKNHFSDISAFERIYYIRYKEMSVPLRPADGFRGAAEKLLYTWLKLHK